MSTGIHLHYEIRNPNNQSINPVLYLDNNVQLPGTSNTNTSTTQTNTQFKVNDKIKINSNATVYTTGVTIPLGVKNKEFTIQQIQNDRVLIKEIVSWVYAKDITLVSGSFKEYNVVISALLNIRTGAGTNYPTNGTIPKDEIHTIIEESNGTGANKWGKLKNGKGWISLDYATKK